jgi:hypothetical protein
MNTLLQSSPNAGPMQLIILLIIVVVVILFKLFSRKKVSEKNKIVNSEQKNSVVNISYRQTGIELIDAGKKLVASLLLLICTILGNYIFYEIYYDRVSSDFRLIEDLQKNLQTLMYVDLFLMVIILTMMYLGFYSIRKAGESLLE